MFTLAYEIVCLLLKLVFQVMLTYYNGKSYAYLMRNATQHIIFNKNDYYIAAVIDYTQIIKKDLQQMGLLNLHSYLDIIDECGKYVRLLWFIFVPFSWNSAFRNIHLIADFSQTADIVVFPECGLYGCVIKDRKKY